METKEELIKKIIEAAKIEFWNPTPENKDALTNAVSSLVSHEQCGGLLDALDEYQFKMEYENKTWKVLKGERVVYHSRNKEEALTYIWNSGVCFHHNAMGEIGSCIMQSFINGKKSK